MFYKQNKNKIRQGKHWVHAHLYQYIFALGGVDFAPVILNWKLLRNTCWLMASPGSLLEHFEVSSTFYLEENCEGGLSTVESLCASPCVRT